MTTMTFDSSDPTLNELRVEHGALGAHADALMNSPAFLDPFHRLHMQVVGEVSAAIEAIHGSAPITEGQGFETMSFPTGTPTVATGESDDNSTSRAGGYDVSFQT